MSQLSLGWYLFYWTQTTHTIDYGVSVANNTIKIDKVGRLPMPVSVEVNFIDGSSKTYVIPLEMMRGNKETDAEVLSDWSWVKPSYLIEEDKGIKSVQLFPNGGVADLVKTTTGLRLTKPIAFNEYNDSKIKIEQPTTCLNLQMIFGVIFFLSCLAATIFIKSTL